MKPYTDISIIYNPNSTGASKTVAEDLVTMLEKSRTKVSAHIVPTKHAGHAETLAYELAKKSKRPLIISSSGDGGYHEVINGLMRARSEGATQAVAGLLPGGNANDHYHHMHDDSATTRIVSGESDLIDLLEVSATIGGKKWQHYAHSYIGIGLTPHAGEELTKTKLNPFIEKAVSFRAIFTLKPVALRVDGRILSYDSLVFSNVQKMAKVLTLSSNASVHDGKFEVTAVRHKSKLALLGALIKQVVLEAPSQSRSSSFAFETTKRTSIQLDGEVYTIDAYSSVTIQLIPEALPCII